MDYDARLQLSYYETVSDIDADHQVFLVRHRTTGHFFVKKILSVFHESVYRQLLSNPINGLPKIYCVYKEDNLLTVIEEYISGDTFEEILKCGKPLKEDDVISYGIDLCNTVLAMHRVKPAIIHRDIKPSNVMLRPDGHVVLLDLNASRPAVSKEEDTSLIGTKGYAAPEQYGFGSSDARTDIYAIGMLMNTLLWGHFEHSPFPKGKIRKVIKKCIQIDPRKRYADIDSLLFALKETQKLKSARSYLPPGFRTGTLSHIQVALFGYFLVIYLSFTYNQNGATPESVLALRIAFFVFSLFGIIVFCDYLGIQGRMMPLCRSSKGGLRFLGSLILFAILFSAFLITAGLLLYIFEPK